MDDQLLRTLINDDRIRVVAAVTTEICREGARRHDLMGQAASAMGRLLTGTALLATLTKTKERVTVQIAGTGDLARLTAEADSEGNVRGFPSRRKNAPAAGDPSDSVSGLVGSEGLLSIARDLGHSQIYQGRYDLASGEIDVDIEGYLNISEQLPSRLRCRVLTDEAGVVAAAAGVLLQGVPGETRVFEECAGPDVEDALRRFLDRTVEGSVEPTAHALIVSLGMGEPRSIAWRALRFECSCSESSARNALAGLGAEELQELIEKGHAELTCHYCGEVRRFDRDELVELKRLVEERG
jgi:molecular chaperone Hsp33